MLPAGLKPINRASKTQAKSGRSSQQPKAHNVVEMLDIYDENMTHLGVKEREAVHHDGDWHRTFHCWIVYRDGQDYIVVQKRGPDKQFHPNMLDVTAAGHYEAGETIADGVREIQEELGITVLFDHLLPVGGRWAVGRDGNLVDREFNEVFLLNDDRPLTAYDYQREEVSDLVRIRLDDALALFAGEREAIPAEALEAGAITIRQEDFVELADHYTYRVLVLAKRFLNGEKYLVI
jgi:isopentenyldiphosphate isomerase